jgi:hypothetical protein
MAKAKLIQLKLSIIEVAFFIGFVSQFNDASQHSA